MTRRHAKTPLVVGVYGVGAMSEEAVENLFGDLVEKQDGNISFVFHLTDNTLTDTIQAVLDFVRDPQEFEEIDHFDYDAVTNAESKRVPTISKLVASALDTKVVHNTEKVFLDLLEQAPKSMLALFLVDDDEATTAMAEAAAGRDIEVVDAMNGFERIEFEDTDIEVAGEDNAAVEEPLPVEDDEDLSEDDSAYPSEDDIQTLLEAEAEDEPLGPELTEEEATMLLRSAEQAHAQWEKMEGYIHSIHANLAYLREAMRSFLDQPPGGEAHPTEPTVPEAQMGPEEDTGAPEGPARSTPGKRRARRPRAAAQHNGQEPVRGRPPHNVKRDAQGRARRNEDGTWMLKKGAA